MKISGKIVDIIQRRIYPGILDFNQEMISGIEKSDRDYENYIIPGLIDAHIHIESSMVTPGAFARAAVSRGTTGVVSDPHEIANIMGVEGIIFMIKDAEKVPLKFWFGAPSCVPATDFETSGAKIGSREIELLLNMKEIGYMAEMMNFPGVIYEDTEVLKKIEIAKSLKKKIDGHAPGLTGDNLKKYVDAGISTDHECSSLIEAKEKIALGMKIMIREGSAATNLDALKDLFKTDPEMIMLCSDDLHPEMLEKRHINKIIARLINEGYDLFNVIRSCTINPVNHFNLDAGLLCPNKPADFIVVNDLNKMEILETWINGRKVFDRGKVLFDYRGSESLNKFNCSQISTEEIIVRKSGSKVRVIKAFNGELFTKELLLGTGEEDILMANKESDSLKIIVKDRYYDSAPSVGFINGFRLKEGAFASSIAHDSHNIICIGTNDKDIVMAVNEIVRMKGGLAVSRSGNISSFPLPVAGIMSDKPVNIVAENYKHLSNMVREMGCTMSAPFMTLSFMALLVIPELKLSDRGLFDGNKFCHVPLFV